MPALIRDRWVNMNGGIFRYREAGERDAPAVLLLHGLGLDSTSWDGVLAALADRYRLVALDARGHGQSARFPEYSYELMRDDVGHFITAAGLAGREVNLVGHSLGATVACLIAQQYPDFVARLVLEDAVPARDRRDDPIPQGPTEPVPFDWPVVPAIYRQYNRPDPTWFPRLAVITAPTLIVAGGPSSHVPQELLADAADRIPRARLVTVDAGHHIHRDAPEQFLEHLTGFLATDSD